MDFGSDKPSERGKIEKILFKAFLILHLKLDSLLVDVILEAIRMKSKHMFTL